MYLNLQLFIKNIFITCSRHNSLLSTKMRVLNRYLITQKTTKQSYIEIVLTNNFSEHTNTFNINSRLTPKISLTTAQSV